MTDRLCAKLRYWLGHSVQDFYVYDHGNALSFGFSGIEFYSDDGMVGVNNSRYRDAIDPLHMFSIGSIVGQGGPTYNSVFVDTCNSAGENGAENPGTVSYRWLDAFHIIDPESKCIVGWNGFSGNLRLVGQDNPTYWKDWYDKYWDYISQGYYISQALNLANMHASGGGIGARPTDANRLQRYGDAQIPFN